MQTYHRYFFLFVILITTHAHAQKTNYQYLSYPELQKAFKNPPTSAKPWVFWYWMNAAVSPEGITGDLEAMKDNGIAGAYLMPIKDTTSPPLMQPVTRQLTTRWWDMMRHAFKEADRLGLQIAMHVSDGFALAGGPWITPEMSMQKVVWSQTFIEGGKTVNDALPQPQTLEGYYKDIAVFAFPTPAGAELTTRNIVPEVTTSKGINARFLLQDTNRQNFSSDDTCWVQYAFDKPFTCRSIVIRTNGNNYQSHRLLINVSDDGVHFRSIGRLQPPRHGWQDTDADYTHAISPVTARYFRFIYDKAGSEPGAEDLDAAKWRPSLKVRGIELSGAAKIHQYEGKNGSVWRVSNRTTTEQVNDAASVPMSKIINITASVFADGRLTWNAPPGKWTILRIGHTTTGHTNATGGGGKGLECDKFNPEAIRLQFNGWFGEAVKQAGPALAKKVLTTFHIDSWECGSQNWSPVFRAEFRKRRGYDLLTYLPIMAGIPVNNAAFSEDFLFDIRKTISEMVADKFYATMASLAKEKGCIFTAESVAPTMLSDGMLHYKMVDVPMGEFWLNSPTHDKPNDMMDAISGAHVYGKPIVQAEAFTTVRMDWSEHPGMLKTLQDRNYALGINRLVYHVFTHNPWPGRKPGMTLDGVGLYFQKDQTWWKPGKAWVDYAARCQALLQVGMPVTDLAVFTGEELPSRAVLPDRLVSTLPGIFGEQVVQREADRLANKGEPLRELPAGVRHSANMADPEDWVNPLNGYAYDSFNPDALLSATVKNGRIELAGGASYRLLVLPQPHQMSPSLAKLSVPITRKLDELVSSSASIITNRSYTKVATKGKVMPGPFQESSFQSFGIQPDITLTDINGKKVEGISWTHRQAPGLEVYFLASENNAEVTLTVSLRVTGKIPELWDAVSGLSEVAKQWANVNGRTELPVRLPPNGSVFIILAKPTVAKSSSLGKNWTETNTIQMLDKDWKVKFDPEVGGPADEIIFKELTDWSKHPDSAIRYYSGTAVYSKSFNWSNKSKVKTWLELPGVSNIARVHLNGINCGTAWTPPYRVDITDALQAGSNNLVIEVTNTWANRLIGDQRLPVSQRITNTTAPFRLEGKPLLPAGLLGAVRVVVRK